MSEHVASRGKYRQCNSKHFDLLFVLIKFYRSCSPFYIQLNIISKASSLNFFCYISWGKACLINGQGYEEFTIGQLISMTNKTDSISPFTV